MIHWTKGAPAHMETGMILRIRGNRGVYVVGADVISTILPSEIIEFGVLVNKKSV